MDAMDARVSQKRIDRAKTFDVIDYQPGNGCRYLVVATIGAFPQVMINRGLLISMLNNHHRCAVFSFGGAVMRYYVRDQLGLNEGDAPAMTALIAYLTNSESDVDAEFDSCARCGLPIVKGQKGAYCLRCAALGDAHV